MAKHAPGLADAAQVAVGEDHHECDGHRHRHPGTPTQRGCRRNDGVGAGRDRDGDRDGVADQQCCAGDLGDVGTEVVPADDVGTARLGIRANHVPVADGDHGEHRQDRRRHRGHDGEGGKPGDGDQDAQHLLGGVRRGGHHVGGQHRQGGRLSQTLAVELVADQGRAQKDALDPVATALGQARRDGGIRAHRRPGQVVDGPRGVGSLGGCRPRHDYGLSPRGCWGRSGFPPPCRRRPGCSVQTGASTE